MQSQALNSVRRRSSRKVELACLSSPRAQDLGAPSFLRTYIPRGAHAHERLVAD
jgi:hypothetical protein